MFFLRAQLRSSLMYIKKGSAVDPRGRVCVFVGMRFFVLVAFFFSDEP